MTWPICGIPVAPVDSMARATIPSSSALSSWAWRVAVEDGQLGLLLRGELGTVGACIGLRGLLALFLASLARTLSTSSSVSWAGSSPPATSAVVIAVRAIRSGARLGRLVVGPHRVVEVVLDARLEARLGHGPSVPPATTGFGGWAGRLRGWRDEHSLGAAARAVGALAATGVAGVAYAGLVERNLFTLRRAVVPVLPHGSPPLRDPPGERPAPRAAPASQDRLGALSRRPAPRLRRQLRRQPRRDGCRPRAAAGDGAAPGVPRRVCPRVERLLRAGLPQPGLLFYLTPDYAKPPTERPELPVGELVSGLAAGGWTDLDNARTTVMVRGPADRARRRQRPAHRPRPVCRCGRARVGRRRADDRAPPRPLPAGPRCDDRRWRRARHRRPAPTAASSPCRCSGRS